MDLGLHGESALLTASTSGLGKASAASLVAEGADVTICGRTAERLEAAAEDVSGAGPGEVNAVQADITDPDDVAALVESHVDRFGGLDHVVTSAGGVPPGEFVDLTERDWYGAYDMLVMSVVWTLREAHPHLVEGRGTVACITSRSVVEAIEGLVLSNAVRRSVVGLVKTVAREWAPDVRVNAVLPGTIETNRIEELIQAGIDEGEYDSYEEGLADWGSDIPVGRIGDPRELGDVVAFLASQRASYVNGASVPVDGGQLRS